MSKQNRNDDDGDGRSRVVKGPWDSLATPKPVREPIIKRGGGRPREAIVSNWRGLAIVVFLLIGAPPLIAWITHLVMGFLAGR